MIEDTVINTVATASIIAIIATVYKLGEKVDDNLSPEAKEQFARYLSSGGISSTISLLPAGLQSTFEDIFGKYHLSMRCISRSIILTILSIVVMLFCVALPHTSWRVAIVDLIDPSGSNTTWFALIVAADYINLFKSRLLISWISNHQSMHALSLIGILIADILGSVVVFNVVYIISIVVSIVVGTNLFEPQHMGINAVGNLSALFDFVPSMIIEDISYFPIKILYPSFTSAMFYASVAPFLWSWLWIGSVLLSRTLLRTKPITEKFGRILDFQGHPARTVGLVASAVTASVYTGFRLLSALITHTGG